MKRILATLVTVGLLGVLTAGPVVAAPGGVERYQETTTTYTILVNGTYEHQFTITTNPCDGSISGSGTVLTYTETITGTLSDEQITFEATYNTGYQWGGTFPVVGGAVTSLSGPSVSTATATKGGSTSTNYANHGAYVTERGGGPDAAHSCMGMPTVSNQ